MMLLLRSMLTQAALRKPSLSRVVGSIGRTSRTARAACGAAFILLAAPWAAAQVTFNYTGAVQTYTVPPGVRAIQIQAFGAGGGGGGRDNPGNGGNGGRGAGISAIYSVVPGTVLKVIVGGGGGGGLYDNNCNVSAGAGGLAGGTGGYAGAIGGRAGCGGFSGGGGGGGAASVVTTQADAVLLVASGGGGGQGGALNLPGRDGLTNLASNLLPPSNATAGAWLGSGDGGGGGGGGGGLPGGAGGAANPDGPGPNNTTRAAGGYVRSTTALPYDVSGVTVSATGGLGGTGSSGFSDTGINILSTPGAAGSVVITYPKLTLTKSQPSPALVVGVNSVYTLTVTNTNTSGVKAYSARVVDQLPSNMTYVSSSGTGWSCSAAANAGGTLVTCDFAGTIDANGGTAVLQITARPTNHFTVTNYAAVDPTGSTSPPVPATCTAANTLAGCAAPVVSPVPVTISGYGYEDLNHNSTRDAGEIGRAVFNNAQYVKITTRSGSVCNFPALAVATINVTVSLGAYSFPNVAQGDYCLLMQRDNSLASNNPGYPTAYIGTENGTGVIQFTVGSGEVPPQNFGMYLGGRMTGTVFTDNGAGGGIANNGVRAGSEAGLAGITVILKRLGVELDRAVSSGDGSFVLWLPPIGSASGTVTTVLPDGYTATGGSAGTLLGGSYTRPGVNFTTASGRSDSGITFGMVAPNTLAPNGAQTAEPGGIAFYAHTYTAATGGQVTFTLASAGSPVGPAWSQVLYQDSNCSATLEAGEPQVTAAITVTAGQKVCLIVKQFVPAGVGLGAQNTVTLSAVFNYTNAAPALSISTLVATDVTTVGEGGDLALGKLVGNVTQALAAATSVSARPGDTLQYTLTATNNGTRPLSTLLVSDSMPAFTGFVSASCPGALPPGITGCAVTTQPAVGAQGALQWTFTGSLAPGAQMAVTYKVKLDQ